MQVHDRRVLIPTGVVGERDRSLADVQRLEDVRVRGRRAGLQVPQTPHGAHHQGFDEQGHDVVVSRKGVEDAPHLGRVGIVPALELRRWQRGAASETGRRAPRSSGSRRRCSRRPWHGQAEPVRSSASPRSRLRLLRAPSRSDCRTAPRRRPNPNATIAQPWSASSALAKHLLAFFVIEAVAPVEAPIEPALSCPANPSRSGADTSRGRKRSISSSSGDTDQTISRSPWPIGEAPPGDGSHR